MMLVDARTGPEWLQIRLARDNRATSHALRWSVPPRRQPREAPTAPPQGTAYRAPTAHAARIAIMILLASATVARGEWLRAAHARNGRDPSRRADRCRRWAPATSTTGASRRSRRRVRAVAGARHRPGAGPARRAGQHGRDPSELRVHQQRRGHARRSLRQLRRRRCALVHQGVRGARAHVDPGDGLPLRHQAAECEQQRSPRHRRAGFPPRRDWPRSSSARSPHTSISASRCSTTPASGQPNPSGQDDLFTYVVGAGLADRSASMPAAPGRSASWARLRDKPVRVSTTTPTGCESGCRLGTAALDPLRRRRAPG